MTKYRLFSDDPQELIDQPDCLKYDSLVEQVVSLVNMVDQRNSFSIAIYGEWGVGKSRIKELIKRNTKLVDYHHIEFPIWKYENDSDLVNTLISLMIDQASLSEASKEKLVSTLKNEFKDTLRDKFFSSTRKYLGKFSEKFSGVNIEDVYNTYFLSHKLNGDLMFKRTIHNILLLKSVPGVIIYIDDIDRCNPENIVRLFETLFNFARASSCIFIFTMDHRIVSKSVRSKYQLNLDNFDGDNYLEKMIQYCFYVPRIKRSEVVNFSNQLFLQLGMSLDSINKEVDKNLFFDILSLRTNAVPRKIKNILNQIFFLINSGHCFDDKNVFIIFVQLCILKQNWKKIYLDILTDFNLFKSMQAANIEELSKLYPQYSQSIHEIEKLFFFAPQSNDLIHKALFLSEIS